jgi:hypothetical protein
VAGVWEGVSYCPIVNKVQNHCIFHREKISEIRWYINYCGIITCKTSPPLEVILVSFRYDQNSPIKTIDTK